MAESSAVAFGRYLRTLRERRGHSLDDVESLSRALPERIGKGYLSRCENGRQRVAFSKIITLCRVYDVPSEVLIERMELDLELDRVGGPETEGLGFEELTNRGKDAATLGASWEAYGYFRDAIPVAASSKVQERFRDPLEQSLCAIMNYTIVASQHGRHTLSLHELEYVRSTDGLGPRCSTILLELLSQRTRSFGDLRRARALSDQAVHSADLLGSLLYRAHTSPAVGHLEPDKPQPQQSGQIVRWKEKSAFWVLNIIFFSWEINASTVSALPKSTIRKS